MADTAIIPPTQAPEAPPSLLIGEDGTVFRADPAKAAAAIATGKYRPLTPQEQLTHQVEKEEEAKGTIGSLQEAGKSALNQLLFGVPGAITEETETPQEKLKREAREKYHKTARVLGGAVGFGGSLLAGGELFKGAELAGQAVSRGILPAEELAHAALGTKLAAKAADFATQGAALATPQAIVQASFGDPKKAAETLLWGVGAGAALGGAGELLSAAGESAVAGAKKLLSTDTLSEAAGDFARKHTPELFGAQESQLSRLSEERKQQLVDFAHQELIRPGMTKADLADAVQGAHDKYGSQIGDTLEALDKGLLDPSAKKTAMREAALKPLEIANALQKELDTAELNMPMMADQKRALDLIVESAAKLPTVELNGRQVVKFEDANSFLTNLREKYVGAIRKAQNEGGIRGVETVTPLDQMKLAAYQVAKDVVHRAGDRVAEVSGQPELVGQLVKAKAAYSKVATLEQWLARGEHAEGTDRMTQLRQAVQGTGEGGYFAPAVQAVGAGIGGLVGGVPGAFVGERVGKVAANVLKFMGEHWMEDRGMVALTALAQRAAKEGPDVFSAVLAAEGNKRLAATMQGVQDTVRKLAITGIQDVKARGQEHMKALLGSTSGLTPDQSYGKLGARLTELASNDAALAQVTSHLSSPFASSAPEVADAYQQKLGEAIHYLYDALPKAPAPPAPFAPQYWQPSAADKMAFHDRAEIISNPMVAMQHVAQGTLSDAHLDALKTIYPVVYSMMQNEILSFSANHPDVKLPMAERQSVARFLGTSLDSLDTPDTVRQLQQTYATRQTQPNAPAAQKMPKGKIKNRPSFATTFSPTQSQSTENAA
jgi:hypothetical protein